MKVTTAIQIHKDILVDLNYALDQDQIEAIKLGREALKRLMEHRRLPIDTCRRILPGETR